MNLAAEARERKMDLWTRRITVILTHVIRAISAHWLALANLALALLLGLPTLAPVLMHTGHERAANLIYMIFRPLCHQLPERSFFLFGERWAYSLDQLAHTLGGDVPTRYIGNAELGFKIAICERDVAIYGAALLSGLLFGALRRWLKPLSLKAFGLLIVPMAIDGLGQLFGLWASTWQSRLLTGGLFGLACVWLAFPYLEQGMSDIRRETSAAIASWKQP